MKNRILGLGFLAVALVAAATMVAGNAKARRMDDPWLGFPKVVINVKVVDKDGNPVAGVEVNTTDGTGAVPVIGTMANKTDMGGWTSEWRDYDRTMTYAATSPDGKMRGKVGPAIVLSWMTYIPTPEQPAVVDLLITLDQAVAMDGGGIGGEGEEEAVEQEEFAIIDDELESFVDSMAIRGRGR